MEQLMMNAISQEWSGKFGQAVDAAFKIEYVDEAGGEYQTAYYFAVNKARL